jgi:hypothetical protein
MKMPDIANKPTLDDASARKIARGQISVAIENINSRITSLATSYPAKRGAWLRVVEDHYKETYKETLLHIETDKRRVVAFFLWPLADSYDGWIAIDVVVATFGSGTRQLRIAAITENAVVKLMQGLRETSHLDALRAQTLDWALNRVMTCYAEQNRPNNVCIPTKSGYFTAKWDLLHKAYVFTGWHPDRLLNDREQAILERLRREKQIGMKDRLE